MTGHLIGLLYRALYCKELGMNTVWVFDGKPPHQKFDELYRRRQIKEQAFERADTALDEGDYEEAVKQTKRTIFVRESEREDAKILVELMGKFADNIGFPVIQAPSEAEAQCAWLLKNKLVEGVVGEDIDTLVFGG
jgi:flap endonuclease-1